jgi:hypothetical protein
VTRPAYFDRVRDKASRRWDQLEADPELAGPWHQLFKQVQSPRHVVSELLQNADDAGATEASVRIEDKVFVFEHNGEDFREEHFASLCRFGYSNKRALHTIGFRGIGFKSTFSLGDEVELESPTLSVVFNRRRFSEPAWIGHQSLRGGCTRVRVAIRDRKREIDVEKNLKEWVENPLSLLFFKSIRKMQIGDQAVHWELLSAGPVAESEWMILNGEKDRPYLYVRSPAEPFPEDALAEIRQERLLSEDEEAEFPPASVEIVLGVEGRLYVVLPTEVKTALPFACNAPFIQEPARVRIKGPATSATNDWLLKRTGRLAASTMLAWLARDDLAVEQRAKAYALLSDVDRNDNSFEGLCATIAELELACTLGDESDVLLTNDGRLTKENQSVAIPEAIQDIWPGDQAAALLDEQRRPALARAVALSDRAKLVHWNMIEEIGKDKLLKVLATEHLPRPKTWRQLLALWGYIAPEVTAHWTNLTPANLRIVPVQGKGVLHAASEVVRLGEKKLLQSEEDWRFLADFLVAMNSNWIRFLAQQRLAAQQAKDATTLKIITSVYAVLDRIGLEETSDASVILDRVASEFFTKDKVAIADCIRLTHIAATLGATAGISFRYVTRDCILRTVANGVMFNPSGELEDLLPPGECEAKLLHNAYSAQFASCSKQDWEKWVSSGRSGLLGFVPLVARRRRIYDKTAIKEEAARRGVKSELSLPYVTHDFIVDDWDFPEDAWRFWQTSASEDEKFWSRVTSAIFRQPGAYWSGVTAAKLIQVATTGNTRQITWDPVLPSWVLRLRDLQCLPDTRGFLHKPRDLLRRTVETDAYRDVEPFIHPSLDSEAKAPLLDLLGVRSTPVGPHQMLERLRALAKASRPPVAEVDKWYHRLDQAMDSCSTADAQAIKHAFRTEKLILSEAGDWSTNAGVYLADDPAVPGAATIRASVRHLAFWKKIEVDDRPTAERAIKWLSELPSGRALAPEEARRVRALLPLHAARIWDECGHWINLAGEWSPVDRLKYAMSMQSLVAWSNLHEPVKQQTADLRELSVDVTSAAPFSGLPLLSTKIEERFQGDLLLSVPAEEKPWIQALGAGLRRLELEDQVQTARVRSLAEDLATTTWQCAPGLQVVPYIEGTPVGTPRRADVLWVARKIYVEQLSKARLAKRVPEEVGKAFGRAELRAALDYAFERSPDDVRAYLEENFKLAPIGEENEAVDAPTPPSSIPHKEPANQPNILAGDPVPTPEIPVPADVPSGEEVTSPQDDLSGEPQPGAQRARAPSKSPKPSIMERFAAAHGFRKDGDGRFFHPTGGWIAKTQGMRFPWERRTPTGELVCYYWDAERCLDDEPLQLAAEVWHLLKDAPARYALILAAQDGNPLELSGAKLLELERAGKLKLYPASYRLALESKEHA